MGKFDETVLSRIEEMKEDAGLALPLKNAVTTIGEGSIKEMVPYIGLHNRHGDLSIPGVTSIWADSKSRESNSTELLECYHTFQKQFPGKFEAGYLASDDLDTKKFMKEIDQTIHYPPEINIFHVDLSTRNGTGVTDMNMNDIDQGVLDTWAEIGVLVDSDCLIMSKSMFSFLAYYIRGEKSCNVYMPDCNDNTVSQQINQYDKDPFQYIHPPSGEPKIKKVHRKKKMFREEGKGPESWTSCHMLRKKPELLDKICPMTKKWKDGESERVCIRCEGVCKDCPGGDAQ